MANILELKIPKLGDFHDVPVVEVFVKAGDSVKQEDPLISLESDKAVMEVPAPADGVIKELTAKEGDTVNEGDPIGSMETADAAATPVDERETEPAVPAAPKKVPAAVPKAAPAEAPSGSAHASPSVRLLARELDIDLAKIHATGPKGRIQKSDLLNFVKSAMSGGGGGAGMFPVDVEEFKTFGEIDIQELKRIKKITAKRLTQSWQNIPHVTHFEKADITELEKYRIMENEKLKAEGIKLTVLSFVLLSVVKALKKFPSFNASVSTDASYIIYKKYYNIGVAADTPDGLVVPVVRNADQKGLAEVGKDIIALANRAREKKLSKEDMIGGTFTISSLGSIGGTAFTPIINPPESAILGLTRASHIPVWEKASGTFRERYMLPFALSYDHRIIDGAEAARFCAYLAELLGDIRDLLL